MTDYLTPIYTDMRKWLLTLFPNTPIVRAYANNAPIPNNAIIMTFMLETALDQPSTAYADNTAIVYDSIQGTMQIDCYGNNAHAMARKVSTMWHSIVTADAIENIEPLYARQPKDLTFVNEFGIYEPRFMTSLELQYNTNYEQSIQTTNTIPNVDVKGIN